MKLSIILGFSAACFSIPAFSQVEGTHQGFQASVSTVTRLAPMVMGKETPSGRTMPLFINLQSQLNGPGLNISLGYYFGGPKIMLSAGNTLRYDIIGYMKVYLQPVPGARAYAFPQWKLLNDLDFNFSKYFSIGKTEPYVTVGAVLMNRNSGYSIPDSTDLSSQPGSQIMSSIKGNFNFFAIKTGIGIRYQQWTGEINVMWAQQDVYEFNEGLAVPEIRLGYCITR